MTSRYYHRYILQNNNFHYKVKYIFNCIVVWQLLCCELTSRTSEAVEAGDHNVQVPEEQGVIHTRLEQEGAHVGLEEGAAGGDPSLQLLQGEGAAPNPWCVGLQQHISLRTCSGVLHLVIFCAENQRNSTY